MSCFTAVKKFKFVTRTRLNPNGFKPIHYFGYIIRKNSKDTITYNRYVKLAEGLAIKQVGASVGYIFSITLWGLWGDVAQNLPLFLNLLSDLQVLKIRVGTVTVVGLNIVQLDGIDYYS